MNFKDYTKKIKLLNVLEIEFINKLDMVDAIAFLELIEVWNDREKKS